MALVLSIGVLLLLTASFVVWRESYYRWRQGEPLVPWEPRNVVPWGGVEIVLAVCAFVLIAQAVHALTGGPDTSAGAVEQAASSEAPAAAKIDSTRVMLQQLLIQSVTLLVVLAFIKLASRASWSDLGWQRGHWRYDIRLGLLGFVAAAPPTFLLQGLLTKWFPYHHPVSDALQAELSPASFLLAVVMVVLMAPLVEELLFRVLLQGWFERLAGERRGDELASEGRPPAIWPVIASSALFGLLHLGQGPAPGPLFVLALAMGYLYRQTHRQMPSLVLHGTFNAANMLLMILDRLS